MAWNIKEIFGKRAGGTEGRGRKNQMPETRPQGLVISHAEKKRILALTHEYDKRPETLYHGSPREDRAYDFLMAEKALDLLGKEAVPQSEVVEKSYAAWVDGEEVVTTSRMPRLGKFGDVTLRYGEVLARGGSGVVMEAVRVQTENLFAASDTADGAIELVEANVIPGSERDFVIKLIEVPPTIADGRGRVLLSTAREISSLARFNPLPESDKTIVNGLQKVDTKEDIGERVEEMVGFLGAVRLQVPEQNGELKEVIAIAMERAKGASMHRFAFEADVDKVTPDSYRSIVEQASMALMAPHRRNILHRDVKPGNMSIDIGEDNAVIVKLLDMGLMLDADYNRRVKFKGWKNEIEHRIGHNVLYLRESLLSDSMHGNFSEKEERAWLELSALNDSVNWEDPKLDIESLSKKVDKIEKDLLDEGMVGELDRELQKDKYEQGIGLKSLPIGTLGFMDSDSLRGRPTKASDVYALGISVMYVAAGIVRRRAGIEATNDDIFKDISEINSADSRVLEHECGTEIASLLKQMINANAEERPRDADSVIESLRNIKAREDIDKIAIAS